MCFTQFITQPFQGINQSEVVKESRPYISRDASHGLYGIIDQSEYVLKSLLDLRFVENYFFVEAVTFIFDNGYLLPDLIVDIAGDPHSLFFEHMMKIGGKPSVFFLALPKGIFRGGFFCYYSRLIDGSFNGRRKAAKIVFQNVVESPLMENTH